MVDRRYPWESFLRLVTTFPSFLPYCIFLPTVPSAVATRGENAYKGRKKSGNGRELPLPWVMLNRKRCYELQAIPRVLSDFYYCMKLPTFACKEFRNFIFNLRSLSTIPSSVQETDKKDPMLSNIDPFMCFLFREIFLLNTRTRDLAVVCSYLVDYRDSFISRIFIANLHSCSWAHIFSEDGLRIQ